MTEIEDKFNWNKLAEKGDSYEGIRIGLNAVEFHCCELKRSEIYNDDNEFTTEFKKDLKNKLAQVFESTSLTQKEITSMKSKFLKNIKNTLDLAVLKKGYVQITFSQYHLFRFFEALNTFVDEIECNISKERIKIVISDPSRIAVIKATFSNDTFQFLREGKLGINVEHLKDLLKCTVKDESTVTLLFAEERLEMSIKSAKRKRTIVRKLIPIDFELQEMPITTLNAINYPFEFEITKDDFADLMTNSGRYSEVLGIESTPDQVIFFECSDVGSSEISYDKDDLASLRFLKEALLLDSEIEELKIADKKIFDEMKCVGYYSLTFLGLIASFCKHILDAKDKIAFSLKSRHPLKTQVTFKKLSNAELVYYLAPRKEEEDDDEEFEPTETEEEGFEDDFEPTDDEDE